VNAAIKLLKDLELFEVQHPHYFNLLSSSCNE
jgi:hypothetical protein